MMNVWFKKDFSYLRDFHLGNISSENYRVFWETFSLLINYTCNGRHGKQLSCIWWSKNSLKEANHDGDFGITLPRRVAGFMELRSTDALRKTGKLWRRL